MGKRQYYEIQIPKGDKRILHALGVCIGADTTQRYSLDEKSVIIKTTGKRIIKKEKKGVKYDIIFPPDFTTKLTYKKALRLSQSKKYTKTIL